MKSFCLVVIALLAVNAAADEKPKPNCRLRIVTKMKDGKTKVDDDPIHTSSRAECKAEAKMREVVPPDSEIKKIQVVFKYTEE